MDELTKLAIKYNADKWGKHHYTPIYYNLFADKRNTVKDVLEIGIAEGASLFMWRDFFPEALIYGVDIDIDRVMNLKEKEEDGIYVYRVDQSSQEDLDILIKRLVGEDFDFIIDDGSHVPEHQIFTCLTLISKLSKNGIYVIEDVAEEDIFNDLFNALPKGYSLQIKRVGKRYDDQLIILEKHG